MLKFLIISLVIWFFVTRLMRFKFVVYKGGFRNQNPNYQPRKPEGSITIDNRPDTSKDKKSGTGGEYVDYEEVK